MTAVRLRQWSSADAPLLEEANSEAMTRYLGGSESAQQVARRHENYLRFWADGGARMFVVLDGDQPVGGIGWWPIDRDGGPAAETGWFVLPAAQGRGIGSEAVRLIIADAELSAAPGTRLFAFPSVENRASNALCARNGFLDLGVEEIEFRGRTLRTTVWVKQLAADPPGRGGTATGARTIG